MKKIEIKSGEKKCIINRFSNGLQTTYNFSAEPAKAGDKLCGIVEVRGSNWIFPKPPVVLDLAPDNAVEKGMWDTFFKVYVVPGTDVRISLKASQYRRGWIYLVIVLIILAVASSLILGSG